MAAQRKKKDDDYDPLANESVSFEVEQEDQVQPNRQVQAQNQALQAKEEAKLADPLFFDIKQVALIKLNFSVVL
jgi:hypothetical protein